MKYFLLLALATFPLVHEASSVDKSSVKSKEVEKVDIFTHAIQFIENDLLLTIYAFVIPGFF